MSDHVGPEQLDSTRSLSDNKNRDRGQGCHLVSCSIACVRPTHIDALHRLPMAMGSCSTPPDGAAARIESDQLRARRP
ncbi:hypothetical protein CH63R_10777 [Colletotrichum higginsianum IMI 349063]|uniref:Uncharacterized protein n=1 Tax=Colletotrichum higginsianum (strain IMI 349063) TaxID=759273 RepID=A0A1B7Y3Q0_COLHI|nr:uncharacterized protein CH63R_10777 [Colletotrichum higginsianum IMI 349063]OBR06657.1 hypothetical protein CH63R_10777 [Colletotrichum higginsianum IMI 349063]